MGEEPILILRSRPYWFTTTRARGDALWSFCRDQLDTALDPGRCATTRKCHRSAIAWTFRRSCAILLSRASHTPRMESSSQPGQSSWSWARLASKQRPADYESGSHRLMKFSWTATNTRARDFSPVRSLGMGRCRRGWWSRWWSAFRCAMPGERSAQDIPALATWKRFPERSCDTFCPVAVRSSRQ